MTYDEVQYESYPYSQTQPEQLYTIAKLFDLSAPNFAKARVLELGCASGGNIIPIASRFPKSQCVGVDLSIKQIHAGQAIVDDLALQIYCMTILKKLMSLLIFTNLLNKHANLT
jgi:cyclopropane fatty-acyl-phospholipid synthase-like methyltransferase